MATGRKYPQKLAWLDIETSSLPKGNSFADVHVLEIAVIITDMALNPEAGCEIVVKMTPEAAAALKANPVVLKMHQENGLIKDSLESTVNLEAAESEIVQMLKDTGMDPGEFMIAGSGVATFDLQLIKEKMPRFAQWLVYFPFDIGVVRRVIKTLNGNEDLVPIVKESFQEGMKAHRALADTKAHLKEAAQYQKYFGKVGGIKDGSPWDA
jgi:oligoribonuclease (3'-5' exoribonuclease)